MLKIIKYGFVLALFTVIVQHVHWSVALLLAMLSVSVEIKDLFITGILKKLREEGIIEEVHRENCEC